VVPTFASVAAWGAGPGEMNLNRVMVVDGERDITFHKPLPVAANITADSTVLDVFDKGKDKGAVIRHKTVLKNEKGEEAGDAGRLAFRARRRRLWRAVRRPARAAQGADPRAGQDVDISTRPDQALVYRLCGDRNPLHSDPEFAKRAGFPKPILHGMCTYGITCRGVLQTYADYDPSAFKQHVARFSSPVYPGETVTMELWKDGNVISFEAKVKARNASRDQERQDGAGMSSCPGRRARALRSDALQSRGPWRPGHPSGPGSAKQRGCRKPRPGHGTKKTGGRTPWDYSTARWR
jgi:acyl dehydratase